MNHIFGFEKLFAQVLCAVLLADVMQRQQVSDLGGDFGLSEETSHFSHSQLQYQQRCPHTNYDRKRLE